MEPEGRPSLSERSNSTPMKTANVRISETVADGYKPLRGRPTPGMMSASTPLTAEAKAAKIRVLGVDPESL